MEIPFRNDEDYFTTSRFITELESKDFDSIASWRLKKHKCSIVLFYAPWCRYCKMMKKIWERLGETAVFFDVCAYNCEKNRIHLDQIKNDMPELVRGYPTIIIFENGEPIERVGQTDSERNVPHFINACMRACKTPLKSSSTR